jgi:hypothetical protein
MKKSLLTIVLVLVLSSGAALADLRSEGTVGVYANLTANIALSPTILVARLGDHQSGNLFTANLGFRVDSNKEQVQLQVIATDLYKAGQLASLKKIDVVGTGATIIGDGVTRLLAEGGSNVLLWGTDTAGLPGAWTGKISSQGIFENTQIGTFSHDIIVAVDYKGVDPQLPTGEYSGTVKLVGMVQP